MIGRLVLRHLVLHPVRSLIFVGSYAAGVAVMLALLSIGEIMVVQARDEQWVGGGDVTVVPAGVDLETLRLGGAVFYHLEAARFLAREVLGGPRLADRVAAYAPWIDDRALYLRTRGADSTVAVRAHGQIPSAAQALGAAPDLMRGEWRDSPADRRWLRPTPYELYSEIDRFHRPPSDLGSEGSWAEWHYFNLLWPGADRWLYLSYIVLGDPARGRGGGLVLARYRTPDGRDHTFVDSVPATRVRYSEGTPDLEIGSATVRLTENPTRYRVEARVPTGGDGPDLTVELQIRPIAHRYFPPSELTRTQDFVSGYVAPALRATTTGRVCLGANCTSADPAVGYHDHNWGTWGGVSWDWGIAHPAGLDVLYGGVRRDRAGGRQPVAPFLAYVVDSLGVAAALPLEELRHESSRTRTVGPDRVEVPERLSWTAASRFDTLHAMIDVESVALSAVPVPGDRSVYFAQMHGRLRLSGRLGGQPVEEAGPGFFETYLAPVAQDSAVAGPD